MAEIVVACVGSPFGADALGLQLGRMLDAHPRLQQYPKDYLRIVSRDRPGLDLLNELKDVRVVIIIDAVLSNHEEGKVIRIDANELKTAHGELSTHAVGVAETLAMGDALGSLPGRVEILGVSIGESAQNLPGDFMREGETLSVLAENVVQEITKIVADSP